MFHIAIKPCCVTNGVLQHLNGWFVFTTRNSAVFHNLVLNTREGFCDNRINHINTNTVGIKCKQNINSTGNKTRKCIRIYLETLSALKQERRIFHVVILFIRGNTFFLKSSPAKLATCQPVAQHTDQTDLHVLFGTFSWNFPIVLVLTLMP